MTAQPQRAKNRESTSSLDPAGARRLLDELKSLGYRFTTPTPETHRRVLTHPDKAEARTLRDVLGWSLPFAAGVLPGQVLDALEAAGAIGKAGNKRRAIVRVSSLEDDLFLHAPFPPDAEDAVFFGPDTYRFARFLQHALHDSSPVRRLIDIGTGSGAGAVVAARAAQPTAITVTDVSPHALSIAAINLQAAGLHGDLVPGKGLDAIVGEADLIIANPPFIAGDGGRTYSDGGGMHGAELSLAWALEAADRLAPQGRMLLYTGVAIVEGQDPLEARLRQDLQASAFDIDYREIDPDIFGEMLTTPTYQDADRIAAVGVTITRRG